MAEGRDIIVLGGSAGAIFALQALLRAVAARVERWLRHFAKIRTWNRLVTST